MMSTTAACSAKASPSGSMLSPFLLSPELACHCLTYTTPFIDFPIVHIYHSRLAGGARASFSFIFFLRIILVLINITTWSFCSQLNGILRRLGHFFPPFLRACPMLLAQIYFYSCGLISSRIAMQEGILWGETPTAVPYERLTHQTYM